MRPGIVAPVWDSSASLLLQAFLASGAKPVCLSPQGFRFDDRGTLVHDDWTRGDWSRLAGFVVSSLCGRQDPELFEWRRGVLEELAAAGLPVVPDPRGIQMAWEPTRMLLRLRRSGVAVIDHYVGENLDDAFDFVREWRGAVFRVPEGSVSPEVEWVAQGESTRDRLEDLWQEYPTGPFVLTREVKGEVITVLVLGGEPLASWREGTPGLESALHIACEATPQEKEIALASARAFALDPVAVEISRDGGRAQVYAVRPLGFWKAALLSHPDVAPVVIRRLLGLLERRG